MKEEKNEKKKEEKRKIDVRVTICTRKFLIDLLFRVILTTLYAAMIHEVVLARFLAERVARMREERKRAAFREGFGTTRSRL